MSVFSMPGLFIALIFMMAGTATGYETMISGADSQRFPGHEKALAMANVREPHKTSAYAIRTDQESIDRGRAIFNTKCGFCHKSNSTEILVGPGLMGVLRHERLPVSKRPAIPENVIHQLRKPLDRMPAFGYLSKDEIADLIAFLNTL